MIIGCAGQFNSGKDITSDYLCKRLDGIWHRDALANNVKKIFCETFNVPRDFVEEWKRTVKIPPGFKIPVREALTFIGDGFRSIQETIWIDSLVRNIQGNTIISDIRYVNEAKYFLKNGYITILMWRPGYENDYPNASEQELMQFVHNLKNEPDGKIYDTDIPFDLWIKNDGTLSDLYRKIDNIVVPYVNKVRNES